MVNGMRDIRSVVSWRICVFVAVTRATVFYHVTLCVSAVFAVGPVSVRLSVAFVCCI